MDDLRENIQLEKLRALKPVADMGSDSLGAPAQRKPGLSSLKSDPKAMGKEIQEEVTSFLMRSLPRRSAVARIPFAGLVVPGICKVCTLACSGASRLVQLQCTDTDAPQRTNTPSLQNEPSRSLRTMPPPPRDAGRRAGAEWSKLCR